MHAGCLNSEYELIIAFDKADCKGRQFRTANFERGTMANVIRIGKNRENDHRAAFPLLLPRTLIYNFTNEGDIIADPFMGSGTTAIAAIVEKRHFIGCELNKEYFDKAVKRIDREQRQLKLF
jgi:DNA modification methylase